MTLEQIKELINGHEYDFLRSEQRLGDKICLLTLGGSHAYGTSVEGSDVDVRGCAMNTIGDLLGITAFEQYAEQKTDTVIYGFKKLIGLLTECNPNIIEMLGCRPEHYFRLDDTGRALLENKKLFLSQRAAHSFGGYATQQLRRLENAIAVDRVPQSQTEEHLRGALERTVKSFDDRFADFENGGIKLYTAESRREGLDTEIFCDMDIRGYPARELGVLLNSLSNVVSTYEKLNHRGRKKDDEHLDKHAMHLVRLYLMSFDILEKGEIITYRENERDFLLSIRGGAFRNEDGTYKPEFFELIDGYDKRFRYAKENTSLPVSPDLGRIEEFTADCVMRSLR